MIDLHETPADLSAPLPPGGPDLSLRALPAARIVALAPWPGTTLALREHLGAFPAPGEVEAMGDGRLVWAGRDLAFAFDTDLPPGLDALCAITDQSDGWTGLELAGAKAEDLLGRRMPLDLRRLPAPGCVRSLLGHIPVLVIRTEQARFELWGWRSMRRSLVHELNLPRA